MSLIELPATPKPNNMDWSLLDFGIVQRGASSLRVERSGNRFRIAFSYPPMLPETSATFVSRLTRAKRQGLKVTLPQLVPQASPGIPLVDGAGQMGTTIAIKGLTVGFNVKEGSWLTLFEGNGNFYLHMVAAAATADGAGKATLQIEPPLRAPFPNNAVVDMTTPFITGLVLGESSDWTWPVERLVAVGFVLEEMQ